MSRKVPLVEGRPLLVNVFTIEAGLRVTGPCVDRITRRLEMKGQDRLHEGGVADSGVCPKFDEGLGTNGIDDPERKGNVPCPARGPRQTDRTAKHQRS